ncbi:MAG: hypothetical protein KDD56_09120, partial [Bdellovibrionales bacterium]|nr:hypothetical protein [Bdellovibrionales bacterium]
NTGNVKAIACFPNYHFNEIFNSCQSLRIPEKHCENKEVYLFAHKDFLANQEQAKCLNIAIRDAWIELKQGGATFDVVTDLVTRNKRYLRTLARCSGLYSFDFTGGDFPFDFKTDNQDFESPRI